MSNVDRAKEFATDEAWEREHGGIGEPEVEQADRMVHFSNPGEIDPRVWSTFGVSVKETDNAIGQFGTGLKYAIAVLMREGRSLSIRSGSKNYVFGVQQEQIRGKDFAQITCNGEPLPFTTHLGSKWELWQAYRELCSNCLDEGGDIGDDGDTVISAEIGDIDHHSVFLKKRRLIHQTSACDIYAGESDVIYYKGIRAAALPRRSLFTYDIKSADLTEDRTFKYNFQIDTAISEAAMSCDDRDFFDIFFTQSKDRKEQYVDFEYCDATPSETVLAVVSQYRRENIYKQPGMLRKTLDALGADVYEPMELDERQRRVVEKAVDFCGRIGFRITHPIHLAELGSGTLAIAHRTNQTIYLSERVLTQGLKQVASTLIEEHLHLQEGLKDCTYDMQSYLFDQIVTMGERLTGEIL